MMKCFFPLFVFILFFQSNISSQFSDNFSDSNLHGWQGDTSDFIINNQQQLQLTAPSGAGDSWIYTELTFLDSMRWDIYFKLEFAPSTSNQLKIYLALDSPDYLTASGYYIEIGASGDTDAIDFKYLNNGVSQLIASSASGSAADEPVEFRLQVVKNSEGLWQFYNMVSGSPVLLFTATHDLILLSSLDVFGIFAKYTSTRTDKFYFDDISIEIVESDVTSPVLQSINVSDPQTLVLLFDEIIDAASAMNSSNYMLSPGSNSPGQTTVNGNQVTITWNENFVSQQNYLLTVTGVTDLAGNIMTTTQMNFIYTQIAVAFENEILITEIMADPTPMIGLPDAEYIELFNNSNNTFNLSGYKIRFGTSVKQLPDYALLPGDYVIVTEESNASLLTAFGNVISVDNISLTNSGTSIAVINDHDEVIHEVTYSLAWYHNADKSDGGWSLEMINPKHVCASMTNWIATNSLTGGTPGKENSQLNTTADTTGPQLISVYTGTAGSIQLRFNEKIDEVLMTNPNLYSFEPALEIADIELANDHTLNIILSMPLEAGVSYYFLPTDIYDCLGNRSATSDSILFGLVSAAMAGDLLINEILFNPESGGSRFIEIINVSEKFIALNTIAIARMVNGQNDIYPITINEIIAPGTVVAFASDPEDILSRYIVPNLALLFKATLPSWDEKTDNAAIISSGVVIDSFTYSSTWHHPVISDQNGVSLERISLSVPANISSNWHSASSLHSFATPTGENSQKAGIFMPEAPLTVENRHFSPDGDGFKDFLLIHFEHEGGNDVGSIWIYDLQGREILRLLSNENLGTVSQVVWDGRNSEGLLSEMGIYLIFVQVWDSLGSVSEFLESCALIKR